MNAKKPTKDAPVPSDAELRATIAEAKAAGSRGAASRQPVLAAGAAAALEKLDRVRKAIQGYYTALDNRQHGGSAQNHAFSEIQTVLGMSWQQQPVVQPKPEPAKSHSEIKLKWVKKRRGKGSWRSPGGSQLMFNGVAVAYTQSDDGKWFWYGGYGTHRVNSCHKPVASEVEAQAQAMKYVKTAYETEHAKTEPT